MSAAGKIEFETHPVERAYGAVFAGNGDYRGPNVMLTYSRYAEGCFLAMPPSEKNRLVPEFQAYLRGHQDEYKLGPEKKKLLHCSPDQFKAELLARIKAETETTKLWTASNGIEGYIGREVMTGKVPSRRSGRRADVLSKWPVSMMTPLCLPNLGIVYVATQCGCNDNYWDQTKVVYIVCAHAAAINKRAWDEQADPDMPESSRRIKFGENIGAVFLPFNISPVNAMDEAFRRYGLNETLKSIDNRELEIPENYDPLFLDAIDKGRFVFEAIRQWWTRVPYRSEQEKKAIEGRLGTMKSLRDDFLAHQLKKNGFERVGTYALEFKGTPFETLCETYERGNEIIRPVLRHDLPPLLVRRVLSSQKQIFYTPDTSHPLSKPFVQTEDVDDRTRQEGTKEVIIPGPRMPEGFDKLYMHPLFRREYAKLIRENSGDRAGQLIKELGLSLF